MMHGPATKKLLLFIGTEEKSIQNIRIMEEEIL